MRISGMVARSGSRWQHVRDEVLDFGVRKDSLSRSILRGNANLHSMGMQMIASIPVIV